MSDAEPEEVSVVVERAGIEVEKSFEPEDFPVPAIAFVIRSERDEPAEVRIVDSVPDDVPTQDIGFHPKYGADFWYVEDDRIVFEREFGAGEEYTTVYGLRAKDTDDIDRFLTEPDIEGVGEERVGDIIGEGDGTDAEDDGIGTDANGTGTGSGTPSGPSGPSIDLEEPGADDTDEADGTGEAPEPREVPEPREETASADLEAAVEVIDDATGEEPAPGTDGADGIEVAVDEVEATESDENGVDTAAVEAVTPDDLAATLAEEIRAGEVADEDLATLREALSPEFDPDEIGTSGSLEARVEKLQRDVTEVTAYAEALEAFLDDGGTAEELLELREEVGSISGSVADIEGTVDEVEDRVAGVEETATANATGIAEVESAVEGLEDSLDDVQSEVSALREDLDELAAGLGDDLDERVASVEAQLEGMEDEIKDLEKLRQVFAGND